MSSNRIATVVRTAAVTALIGLPALGFAGTAAAMHPDEHPPAVEPLVGSEGGQCSTNRVGVDADTGEQLICVGGGVWSGTNGGIDTVHDYMSACDPAIDPFMSQSPEGQVITCNPQKHVWDYGR
ncbi:hypothetical protein [Rhodococcus sp. NPDC058514]|uniref:hypothetical protein n=1 Tax=unclassified Rhodococcus (in: high G+C Gram-positive bacteria) TaxID=192944 RepID=UPI00365E6CB4